MSTYRSRLEAGVHPVTDPRRGPELRAELERFAETLTPRWRRTGDRDDFGYALLRIGARLAEETTVRLDASARRDALAFFDFLGLPPGAPRSATGVLVLVLEPELLAPVYAPAQTQVSVTTADGEQVTFETESRVRLVPGGIAELYSVDPSTDRIDKAPIQVTSAIAPAPWADDYELVTFAGPDSHTVQLSPLGGLQEQDLLEIDQKVYRVKEQSDSGLVTLLDPLETPVDDGASATRIKQLRAFDLRNVQRHEAHIGHRELLNLDQPATITLHVSPGSLAGELFALDIDFALFGTRGDEDPEWHPLDVLGVSGSCLRLAKTWAGSVDETEVSGIKNRWLRARLRTPIEGRASATEPVAGVLLTVASAEEKNDEGNGASEASAVWKNEGSRTVLHAAHNGTPLATTGRFYPFGPEPVRFDTFALAAPEALSKKGAMVTLGIGLSDASMESFGVAAPLPGTGLPASWQAYGAGSNGYLQAVRSDSAGSRWLEVRVTDDDGRPILLGNKPPVAVGVSADAEVVVLEDRNGDWWSGVVQQRGTPLTATVLGGWHRITRPPVQGTEAAGKRLVVAAPPTMESTTVVMMAVSGDSLYTLAVDAEGKSAEGKPEEAWHLVSAGIEGQATPALSSISFLTGIQGIEWPRQPDALEVVARDAGGLLWIGALEPASSQDGLAIRWDVVEPSATGPDYRTVVSHSAVGPTATRFEANGEGSGVWVSFATESKDGRPNGLYGLDIDDVEGGGFEVRSTQEEADVDLEPDCALHAHPTVVGIAGYPAVVGVRAKGTKLVLWQWDEDSTSIPLSAKTSSRRPLIVRTKAQPDPERLEILVPGSGGRLVRTQISKTIPYSLHDGVELDSDKNWAPDRLYLADDLDDPKTSSELSLEKVLPKIFETDANHRYHRVFEIDSMSLDAGKRFRFLRLKKIKEGGENKPRPYAGEFVASSEPAEPRVSTGPSESTPRPGPLSLAPPTMLRLAPDDNTTGVGTRIVIGTSSFTVRSVDRDRVATLNAPTDSASADYFVADQYAEGLIIPANLGSLVRLETDHAPEALIFPPPASPRAQSLLRRGSGSRPVWAQLAQPWATKPADGSLVLIAGDYSRSEVVRPRDYRNPELSWEYFDGEAWQRLASEFRDSTDNLSNSGEVRFRVPHDLTTTEIGGKEDYWIRTRLIGGDYGRPTYTVVSTEETSATAGAAPITTQTLVVDTSELNPPEIIAIEATFSGPERVPAEAVLVENNGDVLDQTQAATVPTATFELFQGAAALDPETVDRAVFAGFTGPIDAGPFTLFVDAEERPGRGTMDVDVLTPDGWRRVAVDDETASMRRTGLVHLSLDRTPVPSRLFGEERIWLRFCAGDDAASGSGRDRADAGSWAPVVRRILPNAVLVSHATTLGLEILGSSQGEPGTTVFLSAVPVLPDSVELRVREDLSEEERTALDDRGRERYRASTDRTWKAVVTDPERAPGTWVLWERVDSLIGQDKDARVYVLEPRTGRVTFGDDRTGRIPPAGRDNIRCFSYQQGGGADGNVPAWSETTLTSAVSGVEAAALPLGTAGGADAPPADAVFATAPQQLRHAGRALAPADVEDLAVASSGEILRARCRRPAGPGESLRVAVVVRDRTSRKPEPTLVQRDAVSVAIRDAGWGGLDADAVDVRGPHYVPVSVQVALITPPRSRAEVEQAARERLVRFFDPEHGGPHGSGWPFGRLPTDVDVLRLLGQVPGIDRIAAVGISLPGGTRKAPMPADGMVCAETADITVTVSGEGSLS